MHFPAQSGVREELLDVQETAGGAVNGVLRTTSAEKSTRDGDFGVVNGQGAISIVNGQGHMSTAQRRTAGGAGKDDVLHFATTQGLGPLFAHDPGQGVNNIGFARTIGPNNSCNTWFKVKGGGRGEGLESSHGKTF